MKKLLSVLLLSLAAFSPVWADPVQVISTSDPVNLYGGATGMELIQGDSVTFLSGAVIGGFDVYLSGPALIGKVKLGLTGSPAVHWQAIKGTQVINLWARQQDGLFDLSGNNVVADHLRLSLETPDLDQVSLSSLEVYGEDPAAMTHRVLPVSVKASSLSSFFRGPENLFDGDAGTSWMILRPEDSENVLNDIKQSVRKTWPRWWQDWAGAYDGRIQAVLPAGKRLSSVQVRFGAQATGTVEVLGLYTGQWRSMGVLSTAASSWASLSNPYPNEVVSEVQLITRSASPTVQTDLAELIFWGNGNWSGDDFTDPLAQGLDAAGNHFSFFSYDPGSSAVPYFEFVLRNQTSAPSLEVDGQNLGTPSPYASDETYSYYRVNLAGKLLTPGKNLIWVRGLEGAWGYGRLHLQNVDGAEPWLSSEGVLNDGWKYLPVQNTAPASFSLPSIETGGQFQLYGDGSLLAGSDAVGWTEPEFVPTYDGKIYLNWPGASMKVMSVSGNSEVRFLGVSTAIAPPVQVLWPTNGQLLTSADLRAHVLVGKLTGPAQTVTVNGHAAQVKGGLFWVRLSDLALRQGMNTLNVVGTAGSVTNTTVLGVGVDTSTLWLPGIGTGTVTSKDLTYRLSGQAFVPDVQVFVGNQVVDVSQNRFAVDIPLEPGMNQFPVTLVWKPTGAVLDSFTAKIQCVAQGIMLAVEGEGKTTYVNQPAYTVSGTVTAQDRVRLSINGQPFMVNGSAFRGDLTLVSGLNTITVTASDSTRTVSKTVSVYYDTEIPVLTVTSPQAGMWFSKLLTMTGTVTSAAPAYVWANGIKYSTPHGRFSFSIPVLQEGQFTYQFQAQNQAGTLGEVQSVTFGVDNTAPRAFPITANVSGWTSNNVPTIQFATTDAVSGMNHYEYSLNQGATWTRVTSPFKLPRLPDGVDIVQVRAIDNAGNAYVSSIALQIDTTPPVAVTNLRAIPGTGSLDVAWTTVNDDVIRYHVIRSPAWPDGTHTVYEPQLLETGLTNGEVYSYTVWAEDHAFNVGALTTTNQSIAGLSVSPLDEGAAVTVAEFKNLKAVVPTEALPEGTVAVIIKETTSPELQEVAAYPIVSPIYSISTLAYNENKDLQETAHTEMEHEVMMVLDYDASLLPNGFPESNLGVYYFDTTWSKWFKVEKSAVDVEHKKIVFTTNHFTDFSVQPTMISDLSPQQLKDIGHSPLKAESVAGAVSVSLQGGTAMTEATDFVLQGRNGFTLPIKRMYDTGTAIADSPSLTLSASLSFNSPKSLLDSIDIGGQLVSQGVSGLVDVINGKIRSLVKENGDYALATGVGWRLNFPYVMTTNTSIAVRLPSGGYYNISQMQSNNNFWLSNPISRDLEFEYHEGEDFRFKVSQQRSDINIGGALGSLLGGAASRAIQDSLAPKQSETKTNSTTDANGVTTTTTTTTTTTRTGTVTTETSSTSRDASGVSTGTSSSTSTTVPGMSPTEVVHLVASLIPGWATVSAELWTKDGTHYIFDGHGRIVLIEDATGLNSYVFHYKGDLLNDVTDDMGRQVFFAYNSDNLFVRPVITKIWTTGFQNHDDGAAPGPQGNTTREVNLNYNWDATSSVGTFFNFLPTLRSTTDPMGRDFEYSYSQRSIVTGGGGVKINFLAILLDLMPGVGPAVSDMLGISALTLSGNLEINLPFTLSRVVAPGIGVTEIEVEAQDLSQFNFRPTDYFLGIMPTALEVTYQIVFRLQTNQIVVTSSTGVVRRTRYSYHWSSSTNNQYYVDTSTVDDGRLRVTHRYNGYYASRNRFISWDDYLVAVAQQFFQSEELTVKELYTLESGNTTYDTSGRQIEEVTNTWGIEEYIHAGNGISHRLMSTKVVRGAQTYRTQSYKYDIWGNRVYVLDSRFSNGREQKTETWNWFKNTGSIVPAAWAIGHLGSDDDLSNGDNHSLLKGSLIRSYIPSEAGGGTQDRYQEFLYTSRGQKKSEGLWMGDHWAKTDYTYVADTSSLSVGAIKTKTGPLAGQSTVWTYDYSRGFNFYTVTQTTKNVADVTGAAIDLVQEAAYDWRSGWKLYDKDAFGFVTEYVYDKLNRLTDTLKPGDEAALAAGQWNVVHTNSPWEHISYNDNALTATVYRQAYTTASLNTLGKPLERYTYDNLGQLSIIEKWNYHELQNGTLTEVASQVSKTLVSYSPWGEVTSMTDPNGNKTSYEYETRGRLAKTTHADGTIVTMAYDDVQGQRITTNERGVVTLEWLNWQDKVQLKVDDYGGSNVNTLVYYDGLDQAVALIDHLDQKTTTTYNAFGKTSAVKHPAVGIWESPAQSAATVASSYQTKSVVPEDVFVYDDAGQLVQQKTGYTGNWHETSQSYDNAGRVIKKTIGVTGQDTRQEWDWYDLMGRPIKHADAWAVSRIQGGQLTPTATLGFTVKTYGNRGQLLTDTDPSGAVVRYRYDALDRKIQMKDPRAAASGTDNFTLNYLYNDLDRLIAADLPPVPGKNRTTQTFVYDLRGNVVSQVDPAGRITTTTYDARNRKTSQTLTAEGSNPLVSAWGYDAAGNVTTEVVVSNLNEAHPEASPGLVTTKAYDNFNRLTETNLPDGQKLITFYDTLGRPFATRDAAGHTTTNTFNSQNKIVQIVDALNNTTNQYYDVWGNITARVVENPDASNQIWVRSFNPYSQVLYEQNNAGQKWTYTYDPRGLALTSSDPNGTNATNQYTVTGLLTQRTLTRGANTHVQTWSYDSAGALMTASDGVVTTKINQASGNFVADPYDLISSYSTTVAGKTLNQAYTYDNNHAPLSVKYSDAATLSYQYNGLGQLTGVGGYASNGQYNFMGRMTSLTAANGTKRTKAWNAYEGTLDGYGWGVAGKLDRTMAWDEQGNLSSQNKDGGTSTYQYDALNRLVSTQEAGKFDALTDASMPYGNRQKDVVGVKSLDFSNPNQVVKFDYYSTSVGVDLTKTQTISKVRLLGLGTRFHSNTIELYISQTGVDGSWSKLTDVTWRPDQTGVTLQLATTHEARFIKVHSLWDERDTANQGVDRHTKEGTGAELIQVWYQVNGQTTSWTYDSVGNRLVEYQTRGSTKETVYDYYPNTSRIKTSGTWSFNYDSNGNLTSRGTKGTWNSSTSQFNWNSTTGELWSYGYDLKNRLVDIQHSLAGSSNLNAVASYSYDIRDLRIVTLKQTVTTYSDYDQNGDLLWKDDGTTTTKFIQVLNQTWAEIRTTSGISKTYYHHVDHEGTTNVITDGVGNIVWDGEYEAFGNLVRSNGTLEFDASYTGKEFDQDTGLYYYNARFYDPTLGRFLNEDPARAGGNWYEYGNSNPLRFIDPTGLEGMDWLTGLLAYNMPNSRPYGEVNPTYELANRVIAPVAEVQKGLSDGSRNSVNSTVEAVTHPMETAQAVYGAVTNPVKTYDAIKQSFADSIEIMKSGTLYEKSKLLGGVGTDFATGLVVPSAVKAGGIVKDLAKTAKVSTRAATKSSTLFHTTSSAGQTQGVLNGIDTAKLNPTSRFGSALYLSGDAPTTLAELAHHGVTGTQTIRFDWNLSEANTLDLSNRFIADAWGYSGGPITGATQQIGADALKLGYNSIQFPSLRGPGMNTAVLSDFDKLLKPQMVVPAK